MLEHSVLIEHSKRIRAPSTSIARLHRLIQEDADTDLISRAAELDPALTLAFLRLANSARFRGRSECRTVRQAIGRLGTGLLVGVALGRSMHGEMAAAFRSYSIEPGGLFRHSIAAALATDALRREIPGDYPADALPAALLHDIGVVVLNEAIDPSLVATFTELNGSGRTTDVELELFGVTHAELGGLIAAEWQLPVRIQHAIQFHSNPAGLMEIEGSDDGDQRLCDVVALAAHVSAIVTSEAVKQPTWLDATLARLSLLPENVGKAAERVASTLDDSLRAFT